MTQIYKFKVTLCESENYIWRDIEISSLSSVAKLAYTILAAFEAEASHLFNIVCSGTRYEFLYDNDLDFYDDYETVPIPPNAVKLTSLRLNVGDSMTMEYDYGAGWEFNICLMSVTDMKKGAGT
ncbi:MAG: plasmid pRiA4b ORF-3 family protein, partial [Oscillospiraceae bacterium]|nr:plasmid pRiA4b ORF-3 family protein [Oscillospiraceae bacterium]